MELKVAIAGAGMAGSYLYRLMEEEGFGTVDIYDVRKRTGCGQRPCAWGFAPSSEYYRLVSRFVDADRFVLRYSKTIRIDGVEMGADMLSLDKPALNQALLEGAEVRYGPIAVDDYDRVIDATGVERAYLGPVAGNDFIASLTQYRVRSEADLGLWINTSSIGYEWCFPLGDGHFHLGYGNLKADAKDYVPSIGLGPKISVQCKCYSRLRMSSPFHSRPFTVGEKVIGVGESIGTVGPLGGDGNPYAMQCAELVLEHWDDTEAYTAAVLKQYDWMRKERIGLERLMNGRMPSLRDVRTFVEHAHRAGFEMGTMNALRYFRKALQG